MSFFYFLSDDYRAPEVLSREGHGLSVDWWSLGALLFDMLTGTPPFSSSNRKKTIEKIMRAKVTFPAFLSVASRVRCFACTLTTRT